MKPEKNNLLEAMKAATHQGPRTTAAPARKGQPAARGAVSKSPGRDGKRNVTGYFPPAVTKQLKQIGIDREKTIQRMLAEALNDYFAKHNKPEVAPIEEDV